MEVLARVHKKGFCHNDLKSNNVVLDNKDGVYNPVVIDFGKSIPRSWCQGAKNTLSEKKEAICKGHPHIAPKNVGGVKGESIANDIFSLA